MTHVEKALFIKNLSCRLPYGVKVHAKYTELGETIELDGIVKMIDADGIVGKLSFRSLRRVRTGQVYSGHL